MKTLEFHRDEEKGRVTVTCATGEVSVYSHCAYCKHCNGIQVGKRVLPSPPQKLVRGPRGMGFDEELLNAAMMFNSLVRDGEAISCNDKEGVGFTSMYRR
ncbi:MAG: hypothetical protein PHQ81_03500 [Methanofollis sp.]|jgi:hypothetical protein|nr:hypothetical protein [Methanofollis sp.]